MSFYESEMRKMFEGSAIIRDATICGKTLLGKLDDELRVKLQFVSSCIHDEYDAIRATVINRTDGVVDKQTFLFSDIIGNQRYSGGDIRPYIWECDGKPMWYIPISDKDRTKISDTVTDYVSMYSPDINEGYCGLEMR